jgi:hypothetical protein
MSEIWVKPAGLRSPRAQIDTVYLSRRRASGDISKECKEGKEWNEELHQGWALSEGELEVGKLFNHGPAFAPIVTAAVAWH